MTLPRATREALRLVGVRHYSDGFRSQWRHSRLALGLIERRLTRIADSARVDGLLQIGDLGVTKTPSLIYQDLSYSLLLEVYQAQRSVPHFRTLTHSDLVRLNDRQLAVYGESAGIIAMSRWLADSLARAGVPPDRIHVVPPGVNSPVGDLGSPPRRRHGPARRLLFIGRDFDTKAGDQVLSAYAQLRSRPGSRISLTIAGPRHCPANARQPGVEFLGPVTRQRAAQLYDTHDLFVMPSRFEGFGIAFVEALSRGLPCIGRRACAMPEIIDQSAGRLISTNDPEELAEVITSALEDDGLYASCLDTAEQRRQFYTWGRAASQTLDVFENVLTPR